MVFLDCLAAVRDRLAATDDFHRVLGKVRRAAGAADGAGEREVRDPRLLARLAHGTADDDDAILAGVGVDVDVGDGENFRLLEPALDARGKRGTLTSLLFG